MDTHSAGRNWVRRVPVCRTRTKIGCLSSVPPSTDVSTPRLLPRQFASDVRAATQRTANTHSRDLKISDLQHEVRLVARQFGRRDSADYSFAKSVRVGRGGSRRAGELSRCDDEGMFTAELLAMHLPLDRETTQGSSRGAETSETAVQSYEPRFTHCTQKDSESTRLHGTKVPDQ